MRIDHNFWLLAERMRERAFRHRWNASIFCAKLVPHTGAVRNTIAIQLVVHR